MFHTFHKFSDTKKFEISTSRRFLSPGDFYYFLPITKISFATGSLDHLETSDLLIFEFFVFFFDHIGLIRPNHFHSGEVTDSCAQTCSTIINRLWKQNRIYPFQTTQSI